MFWMWKMKPSKSFLVSIIICAVIVCLVLCAKVFLFAPPDEYTDHTPPASSNARPDPPNPDKAKHLPSANPG